MTRAERQEHREAQTRVETERQHFAELAMRQASDPLGCAAVILTQELNAYRQGNVPVFEASFSGGSERDVAVHDLFAKSMESGEPFAALYPGIEIIWAQGARPLTRTVMGSDDGTMPTTVHYNSTQA